MGKSISKYFKRSKGIICEEGIATFIRKAYSELRLIINVIGEKPIKEFNELATYFEDKHGLEIGGPSRIFGDKSLLPIYKIVGSCDNCNFSSETVWQGTVQQGLEFKYHANKPAGYQFICEASNLDRTGNESYDFVISSHVIEHIANPLKTILEWKRVLRVGGVILLICPHMEKTFDCRRPITPLTHLIEDYSKGVDDYDLTHLPEILKLCTWRDLSLDLETVSYEQFLARSKQNFDNRCLHHHVFITESWINILDYLNLEIVCLKAMLPFHIIAIGKKVSENVENSRNLHMSNMQLLESDMRWRRESPFHLDKAAPASTTSA
jgi:SAM-dependent methyltransferase